MNPAHDFVCSEVRLDRTRVLLGSASHFPILYFGCIVLDLGLDLVSFLSVNDLKSVQSD